MTAVAGPPRPTPGPTRDYRFPVFERLTLPNGLAVVVAPVSKLPVVTVVALVDAGAAVDPPGREGVAQLTAQTLAEGTEQSDGESAPVHRADSRRSAFARQLRQPTNAIATKTRYRIVVSHSPL